MKITIPITPPSINISEKEFTRTLIEYAEWRGWLVYHVFEQKHYAKRSSRGFPDLVMVKNGKLIFAELKSETGKLTEHQEKWRQELKEVCYQSWHDDAMRPKFPVEFFVWKPSDWDEIERTLT